MNRPIYTVFDSLTCIDRVKKLMVSALYSSIIISAYTQQVDILIASQASRYETLRVFFPYLLKFRLVYRYFSVSYVCILFIFAVDGQVKYATRVCMSAIDADRAPDPVLMVNAVGHLSFPCGPTC